MRGHGGYQALQERDAGDSLSHWTLFSKAVHVIWPGHGEWALKLRLVASLCMLLVGKVLDLAPPLALKMAVEKLTPPNAVFPLGALVFFGVARVTSQSLAELRNAVYASVGASCERKVALQTFEHLQALSLRFHLQRQTGAVLRSVSRGAASFSAVLRVLLFNIVPVGFQVGIVCTYLLSQYNWWFAAITFSTIVGYAVFTWKVTTWRNRFRRRATQLDNEFNQKATDALLNFETVKYFNGEQHERNRYDAALKQYRDASITSQQTLSVLNVGQNLCISAGVLASMILAAQQVAHGNLNIGDFVLLQSAVLVLYQPLGFLGTYYSMLKQYLVDIEAMMKLLQEPVDIVDLPGARALVVSQGCIEFNRVRFGYSPDQPVLRGISFKVEPGQRVAIVGPSGAGKSTIARLLYRFYDVSGGSITIDGQNISHCTQKSLRSQIGIVPQDTVLFNDTIKYNIGYGSKGRQLQDVSDEEVDAAAKAASIYDFIIRQPDGYNTKCGERGLRLSGGEKQRVAIARAILKSPAITLFDEATSSLDTLTEIAIQESLDQLSQGRTTVVIAHRLSTIVDSDNILVLKNGRVVESGRHEHLLSLKGEYASMWERQRKNDELERSLAALQSDANSSDANTM